MMHIVRCCAVMMNVIGLFVNSCSYLYYVCDDKISWCLIAVEDRCSSFDVLALWHCALQSLSRFITRFSICHALLGVIDN